MLAIGRSYNDGSTGGPGSTSYDGHCRVYQFSSGSWTQLGSDIDGEAAGDRSGYAVALSKYGNRVAIGAIWNDATHQCGPRACPRAVGRLPPPPPPPPENCRPVEPLRPYVDAGHSWLQPFTAQTTLAPEMHLRLSSSWSVAFDFRVGADAAPGTLARQVARSRSRPRRRRRPCRPGPAIRDFGHHLRRRS